MRIAVLYTPEIKNVGNAFINGGGLALIAKARVTVPESFIGDKIELVEALETSGNAFNYPTQAIPEYNRKLIESCDWLIMFGGSCLSRYTINLFEEVKTLKVKKILLGVGFYEGIEKELPLHKDLPLHFDHVFLRDKESYDAMKQEYDNVYDSIDLAFWLDYYYVPDKEKVTPYSAINIDSPERGIQEDLYKNYNNSYLVRNDPTKTSICNSDLGKNYKCFVAEKWHEYIKFYANASFVATNRVHTFLACILYNIKCQCHLHYTAAYERHFLFRQVGLELESGKVYREEDYIPIRATIKKRKKETEKLLTNILCPK